MSVNILKPNFLKVELPENAGRIYLPLYSLSPEDEQQIKVLTILLFMSFRSLTLFAIKNGCMESLGNSLADMIKIVEMKVPSIRELFTEMVVVIENEMNSLPKGETAIEEAENNAYKRGLLSSAKIVSSVGGQLFTLPTVTIPNPTGDIKVVH